MKNTHVRVLSFLLISLMLASCGGGGGGGDSSSGGGGTVASPTFSPTPGPYATAQSVTISTATAGATIRYTTDGSTPSDTVGTVYSTPIPVSSSMTINAVAYLSGWTDSSVSTGARDCSGDRISGFYAHRCAQGRRHGL